MNQKLYNKNYIYKYNFNEQIYKLFRFDKVRIGKIAEIFQYSLISYIIVIITTTILNKYIFYQSKEYIELLDTKKLIIRTFCEVFVIIIVIFYIRKTILLFPSLPALYISGFKEQSVMDYVIHTALIFFFLEIITNIKFRMEVLHDRLNLNKKFIDHDKNKNK